ncbi:MAG: hypothetical protein ACYDER_16515 [Ktedonobacteraceae bacterium]
MKVRNKKESNQSNQRVLTNTNRQIDKTRLPVVNVRIKWAEF